MTNEPMIIFQSEIEEMGPELPSAMLYRCCSWTLQSEDETQAFYSTTTGSQLVVLKGI